jgi:two-component sensor histidine kinase
MRLPQHLVRWFIGRGLRGRLVATLCAVLVPAVLIAVLWARNEYGALRSLRRHNTEQTSVLVASQLTAMFAQAQLLANAYLEIASRQSAGDRAERAGLCAGLPGLAAATKVGINAMALFDQGKPLCSVGPGNFDPNHVASLLGIPAISRLLIGANGRGTGMALAPSGSPPVPAAGSAKAGPGGLPPQEVLLGWNVAAHPGALLVLGLPAASLAPGLDLAAFPRAEGIAIIDSAGQVLAAQHRKKGGLDWLAPAAASTSILDTASFDMPDAGGSAEHYVVAPITGTATRLLVGYASSEYFASQQRQFWLMVLELIALAAVTVFAGVVAVDRVLGQWISYFRRIAIAHSRGRLSVRARRLEAAPTELADLGQAINRMADNMAGHARMLEAALAERAVLWQELQHRVKNNFQVIASLLNLYKKSLPVDRRQDIRFVEDHVQSMAIAYRVAYASNENTRVPPAQLAREVIAALGDIGGVPPEKLLTVSEKDTSFIDLDKAIALGLYLAYFLPPRLDAITKRSPPLRVGIDISEEFLTMSFAALPEPLEPMSILRQRLLDAYIRQLRAEIMDEDGISLLRVPLYATVSTVTAPVARVTS